MDHSKKYDDVRKFYNTIVNGKRLWDEDRVRIAVEKKWITEDEFEEITGIEY